MIIKYSEYYKFSNVMKTILHKPIALLVLHTWSTLWPVIVLSFMDFVIVDNYDKLETVV